MRLLCPFCQKPITVNDSEAGKAVNCPECGQQFAAPQMFTPSPPTHYGDRAGAQPVVPETHVPDSNDRIAPTDLPDFPLPDQQLSGYRKTISLPFDARVVGLVPAVAVFLVFLLTFFSWNGLYPGGYPAYTQSAWQSLAGGLSFDEVAEAELRLKDTLEQKVKTNWWLIPYLLLLFPALVLAAAGPVVDLAKIKLPPAIEPYWQYRPAALAALLTVMFLFLLAQWASGFGLQQAIHEKVESDLAVAKEQANTPEKRQVYEMKVAMEAGKYHPKSTNWVRLAAIFHLIATAAAAAELGLALRGKKPPPRVAAMW
jgi:hypothetical protein